MINAIIHHAMQSIRIYSSMNVEWVTMQEMGALITIHRSNCLYDPRHTPNCSLGRTYTNATQFGKPIRKMTRHDTIHTLPLHISGCIVLASLIWHRCVARVVSWCNGKRRYQGRWCGRGVSSVVFYIVLERASLQVPFYDQHANVYDAQCDACPSCGAL